MLNLNVGILGHVDSGKTSLAKCLSEIASTAAFDKSTQSKERGITLDLGFSSFKLPVPEHLKNEINGEAIQYTLVDCPGHASLIKTIICGAHIIDMMLLIIDATKGVQTQTGECLVLGEITTKKMIIVLNKIDLLEEHCRDEIIHKMKIKLKKTLTATAFSNEAVPIISISVNPENLIGIKDLMNIISSFTFLPIRNNEGPLILAVDHCFAIKGQGTVLTGTILQGNVQINDTIYIPSLNTSKKVKSMQMFRKPVTSASQGDRLGICVVQFDPKLLERGIVCSQGVGNFINYAITKVNKIKYFKQLIESKSKFHITIGYETHLAQITLFSITRGKVKSNQFNFEEEYAYQDLIDVEKENLDYFMLLEFEKPIFAIDSNILIGSKLDMDIQKNACRLAFWGKLLASSNDKDSLLTKLKIFRLKTKLGVVERIVDANTVIVKSMFKKETDRQKFYNLKVTLSTGEIGRIEGSFGQIGKIKVIVPDGVKSTCCDHKTNKITVSLEIKRFLFDVEKKIYQ